MINPKNSYTLLFIFIFSHTLTLQSQKRHPEYHATLTGMITTGNRLPFWLVTNRHGLYPEQSGSLLELGFNGSYERDPDFRLSYGCSAAGYLSANANRIIADQCYITPSWRYFSLDLGMKQPESRFSGLSVSNGDIIRSGNSRNFTGYNFRTDYIPLPFCYQRFFFKFNFADYLLFDKRYIRNERLHHQSLHFRLQLTSRLTVSGGFDIWAQWGGTSPEYGKHPSGIKNYLRVITGSSGGTGATLSDRINVLGNQLGKKVFTLNYCGNASDITLQYDTPFEDKSGMRFKNFPDGIYTFHYTLHDKTAFVSDFVYEFHYTKLQSGKFHDRPATPEEIAGQDPDNPHYGKIILGGSDNYFNNSEYRSGWTYYGRTVGTPLMTAMSPNSAGQTLGVANNRYVAHHVGIKGLLGRTIPYKLLLTYSKNYGCYTQRDERFSQHPQQLSLGLEGTLPPLEKLPLRLGIGIYGDWGELYPHQMGFSLSITPKI